MRYTTRFSLSLHNYLATHALLTSFIPSRPPGSLFELLGGNPNFGFAVSAGIAVVGFPTTLFLFIAAIKKAKW
jgi:hypothetical protein